MKPLTWWGTSFAALIGFMIAASTNAILLASGAYPILLTPALGPMCTLIAVGLFVVGRKVRHFQKDDKHAMNPMLALRIVLFARASALVCALLVGGCLGIVITSLGRVEAPAVYEAIVDAAIAGSGLALWMSVGLIVEKWGQTPEDPPFSQSASDDSVHV